MKVDNHVFSTHYKGAVQSEQKIDKDFYEQFLDFTNAIELDCDESLKSFNGLYGLYYI